MPIEEQRAYATLGSTYHDFAITQCVNKGKDRADALDKADRCTKLAVQTGKQLLVDFLSSTRTSPVSKAEAGHMMARGFYNLALIELSRKHQRTEVAITCLKKALKILKDYVLNPNVRSSSEIENFQLTLYKELAVLFRIVGKMDDLCSVATEGITLGEKMLSQTTKAGGRIRCRKILCKFLMHKAYSSLGLGHFTIAARLANDAVKALTSAGGIGRNSVKMAFGVAGNIKKKNANEYANDDDDFDSEDEDDGDETKEAELFKKTCRKIGKLAKKCSRLEKKTGRDEKLSQNEEKLADMLFDQGAYAQSRTFYERASSCCSDSKRLLGIIVSIGRCLLSLAATEGMKKFDEFVEIASKQFPKLRDDIRVSANEIAVDNCIELKQSNNFQNYLKSEIQNRQKRSEPSSKIVQRLAELCQKIDIECGDDEESVTEMKNVINGIFELFTIDKEDVDEKIAEIIGKEVDENSEASDISSDTISDVSSLSDGSLGSDQENEGKFRCFFIQLVSLY